MSRMIPPRHLPGCCAGIETEYAVAVFDRAGHRIAAPSVSEAMVRLVRRIFPTVPSGQDQGDHLTNGGKFYRERGADGDWGLPEWATAESGDPLELVAQAEAGHLLLEKLCARIAEELPNAAHATAYRHGVCHVNRTSWATHFNVLTTSPIANLVKHLAPHLASNVIYGAGGFSLKDLTFSLAPRCATIESLTSGTTTHNRGLLDTRQLSHCPSSLGRRQHLLCFENTSHLSRYLAAGSTLLLTRLIDFGQPVGRAVALDSPVAALHTFSADPKCRTTVQAGRRGRQLTAVEIQRHYLDMVRRALDAGECKMPAWSREFCERWDGLLKAIENGAPESVADRLDWATKWILFESGDQTLEQKLEADVRFGQLNNDGIFRQLDTAGVLNHRLVSPERIERALSVPPNDTRAKPRGEAIAALAANGASAKAYWDRVVSTDAVLDLSDPFTLDAEWKPNSRQQAS
jgi:hypothetical protein